MRRFAHYLEPGYGSCLTRPGFQKCLIGKPWAPPRDPRAIPGPLPPLPEELVAYLNRYAPTAEFYLGDLTLLDANTILERHSRRADDADAVAFAIIASKQRNAVQFVFYLPAVSRCKVVSGSYDSHTAAFMPTVPAEEWVGTFDALLARHRPRWSEYSDLQHNDARSLAEPRPKDHGGVPKPRRYNSGGGGRRSRGQSRWAGASAHSTDLPRSSQSFGETTSMTSSNRERNRFNLWRALPS